MYIGERDIGETIRILRTERGISREERKRLVFG